MPGAPRRGLRVRARAHRRDPGRAPGRGRGGAQPVLVFRRGRVPGRQPAAEAAPRRLDGGPGRRVRGRGPAADHLLLRRCHPVVPDRLRGRVPGRDRDQAGAQLPVHGPGDRAGQPPRHTGRGSAGGRASRPRAPATPRSRPSGRRAGTGVHGVRRRAGGGRGGGAAGRGADPVRDRATGHRGAGADQRADTAVRAGAQRRRGAVRGQGGRALLRPGRGAPGRRPAAGGGAVHVAGRGARRRGQGRCCPGSG